MADIQLGQLFSSFGSLKTTIEDLSIAHKFQFKILIKDRYRVDYRCKSYDKQKDGCNWRVFGALQKDTGDVKSVVW